jgi:hypothetical protein
MFLVRYSQDSLNRTFLPWAHVNTFGVIEITFKRLLLELLDLRLFKSIRFFIAGTVGTGGVSFRFHCW